MNIEYEEDAQFPRQEVEKKKKKKQICMSMNTLGQLQKPSLCRLQAQMLIEHRHIAYTKWKYFP